MLQQMAVKGLEEASSCSLDKSASGLTFSNG
jgi:hypothetical protein